MASSGAAATATAASAAAARAADDERRGLLPSGPLSPRAALLGLGPSPYQGMQTPLCPYSVELEPPAARQRKKKVPASATNSPVARRATPGPASLPPRSRSDQELSSPSADASSNNNINGGGGGSTTTNNSNSSSSSSKKEEAVDEDALILTIKSAVFLRSHWAKAFGFWLLNLLTAGLLFLVCRWYPDLLVRLRYLEVGPTDPRAEMVLVTSLNDAQSLATVMALDLTDLTQGWQPSGALQRQLTGARGHTDAEALAAVAASPRMFIWRHERFWLQPRKDGGWASSSSTAAVWLRRGFDLRRSYKEIHRLATERVEEALVDDVALDRSFCRALTYGENQLDIDAPAFPTLVLHEVLKPFFAFQVFSFVIWVLQAYYTYLYVVVALSVITILQAAYAEYQNLKALERLAKADGVINKIRLFHAPPPGTTTATSSIGGGGSLSLGGSLSGGGGGGSQHQPPPPLQQDAYLTAVPVSTSSLQPGDVVHISTNMVLPCDVLLLTGSCVMSEAMLTGESAPVLKAALPLDAPGAVFRPDSDRDGKYVLYSGTKVLQAKCGGGPPVPLEQLAAEGTRSLYEYPVPGKEGPGAAAAHQHHHLTFSEMPAMGLVLKTGFGTARGQLIRAILFPKPSKFNFERQTFLFLRLLLLALGIGIAFQVAIYSRNGIGPYKTFLDSLNLVTVAVPPALPLALSVGISVALARLKSFGIFCSDASRISAAGRVNCLCFDKTGTLTTDGLTLKGVAYVQGSGGGAGGTAPGGPASPHAGGTPPLPNGGNNNSSSSSSSGSSGSARAAAAPSLGAELVTDVAQLHVEALQEGVRSKVAAIQIQRTMSGTALASAAATTGEGDPAKAPPILPSGAATAAATASSNNSGGSSSAVEAVRPANNHKLMLSYVMAACHSISILDQTDEATALVLRCNSEIIADPSFPELRRPETLAMLHERGLVPLAAVQELVLDPEHDETILVKVEVEEPPEDGDENGDGGGFAGLGRSLSRGGTGGAGGGHHHHHHGHHHHHHHHHHSRTLDEESDDEEDEVILDLPTLVRTEGGAEKTQHLVGDSLEILCFQESGWRYCVRPTEPPNLQELLRGLKPGQDVNALFRDGAFDDFNVWRHPRLAPYVDTVLLPPASLKGNRHASALAMVRRFDFDSDLRRMSSIIRTLPNLEAAAAAAASGPRPAAALREGSRRRLVYDEVGQHFLLVKGAPESIKDICRPETLPPDLEAQLQKLTLAGYRVLACGTRCLEHLSESEMLTGGREELEQGLTFVGLLVMENSLKEETAGYLRAYQRAGLRQLMVTGDNPLTAIAVSKMAGTAFLCAWRRPLLVDLMPAAGTPRGGGGVGGAAGEMRLTVSDVLDPSLRWDFLEYLQAHLGGALLTVVGDGGEEEEAETVIMGSGSSGNAANGGEARYRRPSRSRSGSRGRGGSSAAAPPPSWAVDGRPKPPPLAEVDLVCTGRAFGQLWALHAPLREEEDPDGERWTALEAVLLRCNVFARMSPHNKQELMRSLQDLDYCVCMTGDGANDSGALKAADIGISIASAKNVLVTPDEEGQINEDDPENAKIATEISTAEAAVTAAPSIAAPFATGLHHIGAVQTVVTEGRGTLVTSFTMFKYMLLYGVIQFCGVLILYYYLLELSPMQYLYSDLFVVLPFVSSLSSMEALPKLTRGKPEANLVSVSVLRSVLGHAALIIGFQLFQQYLLLKQPWYAPPDYDAPGFDRQVTVASSSKFLFSNFQYIFLAVALCQTYGLFRVPLYRNALLSALVVVELAASVLLLLVDWPIFDRWFQVQGQELVPAYRHKLLGWGLASGLAFLLYERYLVPHKSLDPDPVEAAAPRAILVSNTQGGEGQQQQQGLVGKATDREDEDEDDEDDEACRRWWWTLLNGQPPCLSRFGYRAPLYHRGNMALG